MATSRLVLALAISVVMQAAPAIAADVNLDLSSIAPAEAKTAPPAPKQPEQRTIELHPDDKLIVHCPAKKFPGDKGWIEYHANLAGTGCMISTMTRETNAEAFQATKVGTQKILVGLKVPGQSELEKDCIVTVKVVAPIAGQETQDSSAHVQSYAGQTVFGNKTSAVTNNTVKTFSGSDKNKSNQANKTPPTVHSVDDL